MSDEKLEGAYGWEDQIDTQRTGDRVLLPEGEAMFTVLKLKRLRKEFGSFGTINVAVLTLLCRSGDGDAQTEAQTEVQLGLHHDLDWKITQFFTSIGARKNGDTGTFAPNWATVQGAVGRCMLKHRTFARKTDAEGQKTGVANEVEKFLPPYESPLAQAQEDVPLAF